METLVKVSVNLTQSGGGGQDAFGEGIPETIGGYEAEIGDKLGSIIDEEDGIVRGHIRLIRLKHEMSDWWQDPTAIPSLIKWLREHTPSITADMKYAGGSLSLADDDIMKATTDDNDRTRPSDVCVLSTISETQFAGIRVQ